MTLSLPCLVMISTSILGLTEGFLKPGYCPISSGGISKDSSACDSDGDCPEDLKCCPTSGVYECVSPSRFFGQKYGRFCKAEILPETGRECRADNDCPDLEKCCPAEKTKRCSESSDKKPPPKPGTCPSNAHITLPFTVTCSTDYDCLGSAKCCLNQFRYTCIAISGAISIRTLSYSFIFYLILAIVLPRL